MENSLKGVLVAITIIGLFITCILNFIVLFPQEQGVTFTDNQSANAYLIIAQNNDTGIVNNLQTVNNQTGTAFNQWDVTQGFMGSNTIKQSQTGISPANIFSNLNIIAKQLFTQNSAIVYAIGFFSLLASAYIIYMIIKFVRTGN